VAIGCDKTEPRHCVPFVTAARNIVDASCGPGVATTDATRSQPNTPHYSVLLNGLEGVVRARGVVPTHIPVKWGDHCAIYEKDGHTDIAWDEEDEGECPVHLPHCLPDCRNDLRVQGTPAGLIGSRECADDYIGGMQAGKNLTTQRTKSTSHAIALHSTADCLRHDESEPDRLSGFTMKHVKHGMRSWVSSPGAHHRPKIIGPSHAVVPGEQSGTRRRVRCDPCDDEHPEWRGRRGYACEAGTRALWRVGGYSVGRFSCS